MSKRMRLLCFALAIIALCGISATTALADMSNFTPKQEYSEEIFTDVKSDAWYYENIAELYRYGLVNGVGEHSFAPEDNISLASLLALACRIHACYTGQNSPQNGENSWYEPYVQYAVGIGMIKADQFEGHYDMPATRAEAAYILARILPPEELTAQNAVSYLPDVVPSHPYYAEILYLYLRGIVGGKDEFGDYMPEDNITRAEAMSIIRRLIDRKDLQSIIITAPKGEEEIKAEVLRLVNLYRSREGLTPLATENSLSQAAQKRAEEIAVRREHTRPDNSEFYSILAQYNIQYRLTGETIACGQQSPAQVLNAWLNSTNHRAIILDKELQEAGVGHYLTSYGMHCWELLFIAK